MQETQNVKYHSVLPETLNKSPGHTRISGAGVPLRILTESTV